MQPVKAEFMSEIGRQIAFLSAFLGGFAATRYHVPDRLLQSVGGDSCRHYRVKCSRWRGVGQGDPTFARCLAWRSFAKPSFKGRQSEERKSKTSNHWMCSQL